MQKLVSGHLKLAMTNNEKILAILQAASTKVGLHSVRIFKM